MGILRILLIVVFLIAALAVTIIVLCQEGKSAGLGSLSGTVGNGNSYWDKNRKYSLEGKLEKWTKITAVVFLVSALLLMLLPTSNAKNTVQSTTTTENGAGTTQTEGSDNAASTTESPAADASTSTDTQGATDNSTEESVQPSADASASTDAAATEDTSAAQ